MYFYRSTTRTDEVTMARLEVLGAIVLIVLFVAVFVTVKNGKWIRKFANALLGNDVGADYETIKQRVEAEKKKNEEELEDAQKQRDNLKNMKMR